MSHTESSALPIVDGHAPASQRRAVGSLLVEGDTDRERRLPLEAVAIRARVADRVAEVTVTQTFVNDHPNPIEAVYVFPLSGGCAVADFELTVADRTIKGVLGEREEARREYQEALAKGHRASLMEQERSDVFTVSVGNLPAGERATVRLVYSERLPFFEDGRTELRLPLVLGIRYIPGQPVEGDPVGDGTEPDTDLVPDASRITPPRLAPGFDPKTALSLEVELMGAAVELGCSQHATSQRAAADATFVTLSRDDELLDRDFVLRWRLAQDGVTPTLVSVRHTDGRTYSLLSLLAPRAGGGAGRPRDVVFVLDRSGSMAGRKMASAARACALLLRALTPSDRFALLAFDNHADWYSGVPAWFPADENGVAGGERWLRGIDPRGGTEVDQALAGALDFVQARDDASPRAAAVVLITDGQVGNESAVLRRVQQSASACRVFVVGVDTAVNSGLLSGLARAGGGTATFVEPGTALEAALASIGRDIGDPLVTDLVISGADGVTIDPSSVVPSRIGDLFGGGSTSAAFRSNAPGPVRVRGRRADGSPFDVLVQGREVPLPAIAHVWARERLTDLEDQFGMRDGARDTLREEIVQTSIAHGVLCRFTAFVAVDESEVVAHATERRKVTQPVHVPAGWSMGALGIAPASTPWTHAAAGRALSIGASLYAPEALDGAPEASSSRLVRRAPDEPAVQVKRDTAAVVALMEDLLHAYVEPLSARPVDLDRLRVIRDRLQALVASLPDEVAERVRELLVALDRVLAVLFEERRCATDLERAVDALRALIERPAPAGSRRRARFWE